MPSQLAAASAGVDVPRGPTLYVLVALTSLERYERTTAYTFADIRFHVCSHDFVKRTIRHTRLMLCDIVLPWLLPTSQILAGIRKGATLIEMYATSYADNRFQQ